MDELLSIVQKAIDEKKGERALLYDFHELNPFIDHVVICSAPSVRQTHAIADNIKEMCIRDSSTAASAPVRHTADPDCEYCHPPFLPSECVPQSGN